MSQYKQIYLWHQCLVYVKNTCIMRAAKLIDGINLNIEKKEYNPAKVIIGSNNSDMSNSNIDHNSHINNLLNT